MGEERFVGWLPRPNFYDVSYSVVGIFILSQVWVYHGDDSAFVTGLLMVLSYFAGGVKYRPERWKDAASHFSPVCEAHGHRVQLLDDANDVILYRHVEHAEETLRVNWVRSRSSQDDATDVRKQVVAWLEGIHRREGDPQGS